MSKWGDWMALLSSWALQCVLWRAIPARGEAEDAGCCWRFAVSCPHFCGHPAPMHPLMSACSLLLDVLHWGTVGKEDDFRSLMETEDEKWQMACIKVPSLVVPWKWKTFGQIMCYCLFKVTLKQGYCSKDLLSFDIPAVSCSNTISGQLRFQSFLNTFHQDAFGMLCEISW